MQFPAPAALCALLAALAAAAPAPESDLFSAALLPKLTKQHILAVAPASAECTDPELIRLKECRTADQALPAIAASFERMNVTTVGEGAALLATMAFESGDFMYNRNKNPGTPGQGTKAMMVPLWVQEYARESFPEMGSGNVTDDAYAEKALKKVWDDEYSFNAAAWFLQRSHLSGGCPAETSAQLREQGATGFLLYVKQCLHTTYEDKREQKWCLAVGALKPQGMAMPKECSA
ncbi:hypothetical protein EDC01DRAFT_651357 [Geopyxis carbonaria]|nr:hypothetical protein EDC01DRAFT_651357 [Geopyxis carbonaria]